MKVFWKNVLLLTLIITLIPVGFSFLQDAVLGTNSNAGIDAIEVVLFTVSITFILTYTNSKIIDYVQSNESVFESKFGMRIAFLLGAVSVSAALIMFCFTYLWRYFSTNELTLKPEDYFYNIILAVVISIVVTGIMDAKYSFKLWRESLVKESKLREQNLITELEMLKSQIEPHFLFNTLNSIYVQSAKNPEWARESILRFSDLLSHRLYQGQKDWVTLDEEIEYLENYIEIEKTRQGDAVQVVSLFRSEPQSVRIAPLLFSPLIENAFKYGLKSGLDRYTIRTSIEVVSGKIYFTCENGYEPVPKSKNGGLGLKNLKNRLQLIYGSDHELNITDTGNRYLVELIIPAK